MDRQQALPMLRAYRSRAHQLLIADLGVLRDPRLVPVLSPLVNLLHTASCFVQLCHRAFVDRKGLGGCSRNLWISGLETCHTQV